MNNSKKLQTKKVKKDRLIEKKPITKMSKPWIITSIILIVILIGSLLFDQLYESVVITIDDEKYRESDLNYYLYMMEAQYGSYAQMFGVTWDTEFDAEGNTMREAALRDAADLAVYTELLYKEAKSEGYALTDEEKETVNTDVDNLLKEQIAEEAIDKYNLNKKNLTSIMNKSTLINRYRQDKIDSFDIDDKAIEEGISYDEYKQYDIEYLFISTQTLDDSGNTVAMTADEKKAAFDKINAAYEKAKTTEDWSTLVAEDEEELTYSKDSFIKGDTSFSEEFKTVMMAMNNGDISEVYEEESGYYLVRMVNNNSDASYKTTIEEAITQAENEKFEEFYEGVKAEHSYKINKKVLNKIQLGA